MRSKPPIITIGWYKPVTFDLIRHGLWPVTPSPAGEGFPQGDRPRTSEERLPLEGKLAQRQLRLMRSKLSIITIGWYDAVTFDLIRHAKRRDTVVEV